MKIEAKNIHIVFNEFSRETLSNNASLNISASNIISLNDDLRIGPLSNYNDLPAKIESRKDYLLKVLGNTAQSEGIISASKKDNQKLDSIVSQEKQKKIYLWAGSNSRDIIGSAKLIAKLIEYDFRIFVTDFTKITLKNRRGKSFSPKSLVEVRPSHVNTKFESFKELRKEDLSKWKEIWRLLLNMDSLLRILEINGDITSREVTFFDDVLISFCRREFQQAALIIGQALVEINFLFPDWFLNWRLKELSKSKRIQAVGKLVEMRDYKVKIC